MGLTILPVAIGSSRGLEFDRGSSRWVIILPGAGYSVQAPLLWFAREAAIASDHNALIVTDSYDRERDEPVLWARERAEAALAHLRARDAHPVLVAKSLTSLAAPIAAEANLPAIWLTPLIGRETEFAADVLTALRAATEPMMLIGGMADPTWDGETARSIGLAEVIEIPDADHSLQVADDPGQSLAVLAKVTDLIAAFLMSR